MRIKLDEHVTVDAVELFARFGHDADTVVDEGLTGASDDVLRRAAADAGRMVVTFDVGFADIRLESVGWCSCGWPISNPPACSPSSNDW